MPHKDAAERIRKYAAVAEFFEEPGLQLQYVQRADELEAELAEHAIGSEVAQQLLGDADAQWERGQRTEAIETMTESLKLREQHDGRFGRTITSISTLARWHEAVGDLQNANAYYALAASRHAEVDKGSVGPNWADERVGIARTERLAGRLDAAMTVGAQTVAILTDAVVAQKISIEDQVDMFVPPGMELALACAQSRDAEAATRVVDSTLLPLLGHLRDPMSSAPHHRNTVGTVLPVVQALLDGGSPNEAFHVALYLPQFGAAEGRMTQVAEDETRAVARAFRGAGIDVAAQALEATLPPPDLSMTTKWFKQLAATMPAAHPGETDIGRSGDGDGSLTG